MRGQPARRRLPRELELLADVRGQVGVAVLVVRHRGSVVRHELEDLVPALQDDGVGRDDEVAVGGGTGCVVFRLAVAALVRVAHEVVVGRRLGEPGEGRGLTRCQVGQLLAEVRASRGLHAVALVAVVDLVEIGRDDLLLAVVALLGEVLRHPDGLDDLLELALERPVLVLQQVRIEQARPDELLGDRRSAAAVAAQGVEARGDDRERVEAGVLPEGLVLDRGRGVEHERWDVLEGHDVALELAEAGELDLTGAVEEHGLLGQGVVPCGRGARSLRQRVVGQLLGRFEVAREGAIDRQRGDRGQDPDGGQEREHDDRDPAGGGPAGRLLVVDRVGLGAIGVGHRAQACRIGSDHAAHEDRRGVARA